jgi:hypothetical protein
MKKLRIRPPSGSEAASFTPISRLRPSAIDGTVEGDALDRPPSPNVGQGGGDDDSEAEDREDDEGDAYARFIHRLIESRESG